MKSNRLGMVIAGLLFCASIVPVEAFAQEETQVREPASELKASSSNPATAEPETDESAEQGDEPNATEGNEYGQSELPLPTFYAIDAETGEPIVGVRVKIVVRDAVTGEMLDSTGESVGIQSGGISEDLYKY